VGAENFLSHSEICLSHGFNLFDRSVNAFHTDWIQLTDRSNKSNPCERQISECERKFSAPTLPIQLTDRSNKSNPCERQISECERKFSAPTLPPVQQKLEDFFPVYFEHAMSTSPPSYSLLDPALPVYNVVDPAPGLPPEYGEVPAPPPVRFFTTLYPPLPILTQLNTLSVDVAAVSWPFSHISSASFVSHIGLAGTGVRELNSERVMRINSGWEPDIACVHRIPYKIRPLSN
jgi:hypothetical protein